MAVPPKKDQAAEPDPTKAKRRDLPKTWVKNGYIVTALWIAAVVYITRGDIHHALFDLIFIGPIIGWGGFILLYKLWTQPKGK